MTHSSPLRQLTLALILLSFFAPVRADEPIGSPNAVKGGSFLFNLSGEPTTLNPLSSTDYNATIVQEYIVETLLRRNLETYEWEPSLATDWKISEDGLVYEFTLREGVKWH